MSDTVPFLQIGEAKYGKFLLELAVRAHVDLQTAAKIALGSMLSTAHANLSVGPPYDVAIYRNGSLEVRELRIEADNALPRQLNEVWIEQLLDSIAHLPPIPARPRRGVLVSRVRSQALPCDLARHQVLDALADRDRVVADALVEPGQHGQLDGRREVDRVGGLEDRGHELALEAVEQIVHVGDGAMAQPRRPRGTPRSSRKSPRRLLGHPSDDVPGCAVGRVWPYIRRPALQTFTERSAERSISAMMFSRLAATTCRRSEATGEA